ncbi:hypothetical protein [Botrimarina hoheduenensis]|uniref:Response regulatory domain-containing protein n=1 Tax=Botrimarina hoheduenensis TaxID=2528000 RepID=A0A5C5WCU1_9BACT|nr:hypothetical protein [Botrimarina hoheduenensis]TWT48726.1 hypothetical protein Pla111_05010 [Botrimarina hoheduenensis]
MYANKVPDRWEFAHQIERRQPALAILARALPLADASDLATLPESFPATRFVQLLGPWCEGEQRTGRVLDGYERVFWHRWSSWWTTAYPSVSPNSFLSPSTEKPRERTLLVDSVHTETIRTLSDSLAAEGWRVICRRRWQGESVDAALWEGRQLCGAEAAALARFKRLVACDVPLITLLDFPRPETVAAATMLGATSVFGKPYERDELLATLDAAALVPSARDEILFHAA